MVMLQDSGHVMEQMRLRNPLTRDVCSTLVAGEKDWTDYTASVDVRPLLTSDQGGLLFRYQTSLMHYAFFLCNQEAQLWLVEKTERTLLGSCLCALRL